MALFARFDDIDVAVLKSLPEESGQLQLIKTTSKIKAPDFNRTIILIKC